MNKAKTSDQKYSVTFLPNKKTIEISVNSNLLKAAQKIRLPISSGCSGVGKCGQCQVKILKGKVSPISDNEKKILSKKDLKQGIRLACLTKIKSDVEIFVPDSSIIRSQKLQLVRLSGTFCPTMRTEQGWTMMLGIINLTPYIFIRCLKGAPV